MAEHVMHKKEAKKAPKKTLKEKREDKKNKKKGQSEVQPLGACRTCNFLHLLAAKSYDLRAPCKQACLLSSLQGKKCFLTTLTESACDTFVKQSDRIFFIKMG